MELIVYDRIRNRKLVFFQGFEICMKYDSIGSTFRFDFFFDPNNNEHKELACVGHFHIVYLYEGTELLMTGYVLSQVFNDYPETKLVSIAGYSLPGVLQDCEIPIGEPTSWIDKAKGYARHVINKIWPGTLQSDGLSLKEIAQKMLNPFNLTMVIDPSVAAAMNEIYDETTARQAQTIKSYLAELAAQKNIVITDDQFGRVVFTRPATSQKPIFHFESNIPGTSMSMAFSGQGMHSHIRMVQQQDVDEGIPASESQVENPYVPFVFRPHVAIQSSGDADDTEQAAKNALARELKDFTLTVETDRWFIGNKVIRPGKMITVLNPNVYLYKKSSWFIEEVTLKGNASETTAVIKCVQPCVYDGTVPQYLFKGINLH